MSNQNEENVIQNYQENEEMMILVYAQWCINSGINPKVLYRQAYPTQIIPSLLDNAMKSTVSKNESEEITNETVLQVLQMFGNDDLAFAVQQIVEKKKKQSRNT